MLGEPIIGATILVNGQTGGAVTDMDGNFTINAKPGTKLQITYVGFSPQEVTAHQGMNITMTESSSELDEVVVVGYGSLAKKEISSSIVQIDKSQFIQGAVTDPMALVSGKIAGLNVNTTADANPNALSSIQVRGAASLKAGNGPLIVIDGIPGGDLRNISSQDVESITVLKDAGSAAIYGTRGANGVVLITTKHGSGSQGTTNITYDSRVALNFAKPQPDILSSEEFRRSRRGNDYGYNTHDGFVVYVDNQTAWTDLYLYQWGDINDLNGSWPGAKPTGTQIIDGVTYTYFDMGAVNNGLSQNLIFNNGNGTQLADFPYIIDHDLYIQIKESGIVEKQISNK